MQVKVLNVVPARYGTFTTDADRARGREPIAWRDGSLVEYVDVLDGEGGNRRMTLGENVNGQRLPEGTVCDLVCEVTRKSEVVFRRDGSERIAERDKWRVVGMEPAPAGK